MTHLSKLQRKARLQRWKYVVVALAISLSGVAVTLSNTHNSMGEVLMFSDNSLIPTQPSATSSASPPAIDFFEIIRTLDNFRNEAFRSRNLEGLLLASSENSPLLLDDQKILKKIIKQNLPMEFVSSKLISVTQISTTTSNRAQLEVKDSIEEKERLWLVELVRQTDGSWRYFQITSILPSTQT